MKSTNFKNIIAGKAYPTEKGCKQLDQSTLWPQNFLTAFLHLLFLLNWHTASFLALVLHLFSDASAVPVAVLRASLDAAAALLLFGFATSTIAVAAAASNNHLETDPFVGLAAALAVVPVVAVLDLDRSRRTGQPFPPSWRRCDRSADWPVVVTTNASADVTMTIDRTRINTCKTSEGGNAFD